MHTVRRKRKKRTLSSMTATNVRSKRERGVIIIPRPDITARPPSHALLFVPLYTRTEKVTLQDKGRPRPALSLLFVLLPTCDPTQPPLLHRPLPLTRENKSDDETSSHSCWTTAKIVLRSLFTYHFLKRKRISNWKRTRSFEKQYKQVQWCEVCPKVC